MKVNRHIICLCYNHFYHLYLVALNKNMNCNRPKDKLVMKNKSKRLIEQINQTLHIRAKTIVSKQFANSLLLLLIRL